MLPFQIQLREHPHHSYCRKRLIRDQESENELLGDWFATMHRHSCASTDRCFYNFPLCLLHARPLGYI